MMTPNERAETLWKEAFKDYERRGTEIWSVTLKRHIAQALRDERRRTLEEVKATLCKDRLIKQFFDVNFWDAHHVDIVWRHNGQDKRYEADWLKDLWHLTQALREQARRAGEAPTPADGGSPGA